MSAGDRILIVDDEEDILYVLGGHLTRAGYTVTTARDGEEALGRFRETRHDLVIADVRMPKLDGLGLLRALRQIDPEVGVIMITGHGSIDTAVEAMKVGAYDYLTKPFRHINEILLTIEHALEKQRLVVEVQRLRRELGRRHQFAGLVGISPAMQEVYDLIEKVAAQDVTVMIQGESGTGKELVARAIHARSARRDRPFIPVNCGAIAESLLESELFGHVRGAFTGAVTETKGLFRAADGGTIFLDEIAEISHALQVKLLRVLQEREVRPVGSDRSVKVDVRVVAATNRPLEEAIQDGTLRKDLFYRLNVVPVQLPPLRERAADIPLLVHHFIELFNARTGKAIRAISAEALEILATHPWPGNVRELENVVERAYALGAGPIITANDLPPELAREPIRTGPSETAPPPGPLPLRDLEAEAILRALQETGGNQVQAARLLGVDRKTIQRKLKKYRLSQMSP
ncbi:MAG: sigma-54-dependent Fis family transcriptional regulator [Deltaproteobacteria bacterium]|nr:sigma-54-dependent Fis family transcriptional regulator [Deltaproteobacteria bacterium]